MTDDRTTGNAPLHSGTHEPPHDVEVIRSEERLAVTTEVYALERVRLEKYIVTEQQTFTVDVRREEVRITREPLEPTRIDAALVGTEAPLVLTLSEERVSFITEVVPVELVRVHKSRVTEQQVVTADLRSERVEVDPPV